MVQQHDFKLFPELTNSQMQVFYFDSPHKQIVEEFNAKVVKVTDGDTIRVKWFERNFDFPIRFADLAAPEIKEFGGKESQSWLESQIMGKEVRIVPTKSRVERWGRLLANVFHNGFDMSEDSIRNGHGVKWDERELDKLPNFLKELEGIKI